MTNDELLSTYPQSRYIYVDTADANADETKTGVRVGRFVARVKFGDFWTLVFVKADNG